ncbi:MAG: hypothetical protein CMJ29_04415 [Phycisphaerae bacterium]|nr:hypothetical protein [Phycisphaerae bacterium]
MTRNIIQTLIVIGVLFGVAGIVDAAMPPVGSPPAPAGNLSPPQSLIGMALAFLCFIAVVGVNLIPSKRKDVK